MVQGTTPALTLTIPDGGDLDLTQAAEVYVTLRRKGQTLTISGDRLKVDAKAVTFRLTQEESLGLSPGEVLAQLNWLYWDGDGSGQLQRNATQVGRIVITEQLLEEVLEDA